MDKLAAQTAREQLQLRWSKQHNCWEVFACAHGTSAFRWWQINQTTKEWYVRNFPEIRIASTPESSNA